MMMMNVRFRHCVYTFIITVVIVCKYGIESVKPISAIIHPSIRKFEGVQGLLPVLHNLEIQHIPEVVILMRERTAISVSLRNADSITSLRCLKQAMLSAKLDCKIGASSVVSEKQIEELADVGIDFVSTMFYAKSIIATCHRFNLPILCGSSSCDEALSALETGANAIKFFPAKSVSPQDIKRFKLHESTHGIPIFIAGGLVESDIAEYLSVGAIGFAIGVNCLHLMTSLESKSDILQSLVRMDNIITRDTSFDTGL